MRDFACTPDLENVLANFCVSDIEVVNSKYGAE